MTAPAHEIVSHVRVMKRHTVTCSCGKTASSVTSAGEARSAWYRHVKRATAKEADR